jgi:hypothetical protein
MPPDSCRKVTRRAVKGKQFGVCQKLNVEMPADLDQFW